MLLENLKLLVESGCNALLETCDLPVESVDVSQVRQGQITFPGMARLKFINGTLESVMLGGDTMLCGHLAENVQTMDGRSGIQQIAENFLAVTLENMEGRLPRGSVECLDVGPKSIHTRGTRTFGIKLATPIGQLFILAEVPSRLEYEQAKNSEFFEGLVSTYLPSNWGSRENLDTSGLIDSFLVLLRKTEADVHVELPLPDGGREERNGILIEQCKYQNDLALRINLNLEHGPASLLKPGDKVGCFVGVADRAVEMDLVYLGGEAYPVAGGGTVATALFSIPDLLTLGQRRRAFRIDLLNSLPVEVEEVDVNADAAQWFANASQDNGKAGKMVDLSFSGARIVGDPEEFRGAFPRDTMVRCRIYFPDDTQPISVLAMIRRRDTSLVDRQTYQDELGVEFVMSPEADRSALEKVRQFVLKEQRSHLARRTQSV